MNVEIFPSLSVVLPNYNHAHYLPTALTGLVNQSVPPLEIIVIDDCSQDNSVEVIEAFAQKHPTIKLVRNEKNSGVVFNLNRGLAMARGEYVTFPAADDELLPGFIEKSLRILGANPQAALCTTVGDWREQATGLNWHVGVGMTDVPAYLSPQRMEELERAGKLFIASHVMTARRDVLQAFGGFPPEMKWHADWFTNYVLGFRHGICVVPEPLGIANILPGSHYQSGHARKLAQREVLRTMLARLDQPDLSDAAERLRSSGALAIYGGAMRRLLWSEKPFRRWLTFTFLRKNLWRSTQLQLKKITPAWAGNLYFKFAGLRAKAKR
jgi:glycosyltransferase involved in cell wall biosynthesis